MMCDGDGRHDERALTVPDNVPWIRCCRSPELNPAGLISLRPDDTRHHFSDLIRTVCEMRRSGSLV